MSTPSERLAERIAERLVAEGLVRREDAPRLVPRIAAGEMQAEYWRIAVERALRGAGDDA